MGRKQSRAGQVGNRSVKTALGQAALEFRGALSRISPVQARTDPPSISFDEFRQIVRRCRPSSLLPELGALAAAAQFAEFDDPLFQAAPPWAIALAARESILRGNEYRREQVTPSDLIDIFNGHAGIYEGGRENEDEHLVLRLITRLAYEQFPLQESIFQEVSRTHALLVEGADTVPGLQVMAKPDSWSRLLGAPLGQMVGATFFLQVAAMKHGGWFDPKWLDEEQFEPVFETWPRHVIEMRAEQLSTTVPEFKASYQHALDRAAASEGAERFAFNPLTATPFLEMPDGRLLAPQTRFILSTISPGALYYRGLGIFGKSYSDDLGRLTEAYVGRQLRSLSKEVLTHPEVVYGTVHRRSIDWFWVFPSLVVLVEVKSARFALRERAAVPGFENSVAKRLELACDQIATTEEALKNGVPEFGHVPKDRPRIAIIVTGEPHHLANSPWMRDLFSHPPVPMLTASLSDLEQLVGLPSEVVEQQLAAISRSPERSSWSLANALEKDVRIDPATKKPYRNRLLDEAWRSYPWPENRAS